MAKQTVNLVKLCVGIDSVEHLLAHRARTGATATSTHVTRMWPKRGGALLNGGSLYWVIKGFILARQPILDLVENTGADGIRRCAIVMDATIVRTHATRRRPFQGWRYLSVGDSPPDLAAARAQEDTMPMDMRLALADIGLR